MAVLTRSQIRSAIRRRRNLSIRKFTFVIQDRKMDDDSDYEPIEEEDSESDYYPSSDTEVETDVDTVAVESHDETESVGSVELDDGKAMKERVERLREDLRRAEIMLKKWQAEQDAQLRENNNTCLPIILALGIIWGIYAWLEWNVRHKPMTWY
jgi:hypothetical protein